MQLRNGMRCDIDEIIFRPVSIFVFSTRERFRRNLQNHKPTGNQYTSASVPDSTEAKTSQEILGG